MISDTINQKISDALKEKDEIRLSTLRLLSSAFNYEKIAKQHSLSEDEETAVVRREAKKRQDAIEAIKSAEGKATTSSEERLKEKLEREEKELAILKQFLPKEMPDDELSKLIDEALSETGAVGMAQMGKVIGAVMQKTGGRADGKRVSEIVKEKLT